MKLYFVGLIVVCCMSFAHAEEVMTTEQFAKSATADAKSKRDEALSLWSKCITGAAKRYSRTKEVPETVVTASFGKCGLEESKLEHAEYVGYLIILKDSDRADSASKSSISHNKQAMREGLTALILDLRMGN